MISIVMNAQTKIATKKLQIPSQALKSTFGFNENDSTELLGTEQSDSKTLHAFQIQQIGLLLPEIIISELLDDMSTCRLPNTSPILYGMGNLRGKIIPVFDLYYLFDMPRGDGRYFLVIGSDDDTVAVLLNSIPLQVELSERKKLNSLPPIPDSLRPFTKSCYESDGLWFDCDLFGFFMKLKEQLN